jgi:hypothetical protein
LISHAFVLSGKFVSFILDFSPNFVEVSELRTNFVEELSILSGLFGLWIDSPELED